MFTMHFTSPGGNAFVVTADQNPMVGTAHGDLAYTTYEGNEYPVYLDKDTPFKGIAIGTKDTFDVVIPRPGFKSLKGVLKRDGTKITFLYVEYTN